ncbi:MAG: extracellular solute-binding protein [Anaerolineae bacterium]|nr:extracellular solute-binding protein [Anaerolineae bacterium]
MKLNKLLLIVALIAALIVPTATRISAQDDTWMGKTAAELFPGAANDQERDSAFKALVEANLPDATSRFAGQTLTVAVQQAGARGGISGPYYFWRDVFETATGATLEIVEIPQAQYFTTTSTDFLTGQNSYDVMNIGAWFLADYVYNGWIQPVDQFFDMEGLPVWERDAVFPSLANLMQWEGQWYGVLNDGDAQMLYYRKDILTDPQWQEAFKAETGMDMPVPPTTWQQLLAVTTFFNGKDWNGDGDPDDGISLHLKSGGQNMFHYMSLSAPFAITPAEGEDIRKVTKYDNVYWFDPDDLTPLINQPGHVAGLEFLKELAATGSEAQFSWDLAEAWNNFLNGNAIATFSWGDVGSLAQDPSRSVIQGKLGGARIPCSERWYDREKGEFVEDAANPNCVGNTTGGSWYPVMSAFTDTPELAYYFMAMHAAKPINFWNVYYGWTGVDPGATYDLFPPLGTASVEDYVAAGYNREDALEYITGYGENFYSHPIYETYLRIPGTVTFWEILDVRLAQAMTDQLTAQEALDLVAQEWDAENNDLGRDEQLQLYQIGIGYTPGQ